MTTAAKWNGKDWPEGCALWWICTKCERAYKSPTTGKPPAHCVCLDEYGIVLAQEKKCAKHPTADRLDGCGECVAGEIAQSRLVAELALADVDTLTARSRYLGQLIDEKNGLIQRLIVASGTTSFGEAEQAVGIMAGRIADLEKELAKSHGV